MEFIMEDFITKEKMKRKKNDIKRVPSSLPLFLVKLIKFLLTIALTASIIL
jgi:hypothetical protein